MLEILVTLGFLVENYNLFAICVSSVLETGIHVNIFGRKQISALKQETFKLIKYWKPMNGTRLQ